MDINQLKVRYLKEIRQHMMSDHYKKHKSRSCK